MSTPDLPDGIGQEEVRAHAMHLSLVARTVNLTSTYLEAEGDEAHEAEMALDAHAQQIVDLGPHTAVAVILSLAAVVAEAGDEPAVQAWFDRQRDAVTQVLDG